MNAERILIAAECIGDAKWFLEKGASYASERVVFERPIGQNQGGQFPLRHVPADRYVSGLQQGSGPAKPSLVRLARRVHFFSTCALLVHREIKTGPNVCNLSYNPVHTLPLERVQFMLGRIRQL